MLVWRNHEGGPLFLCPPKIHRSIYVKCLLQMTVACRNGNSRLFAYQAEGAPTSVGTMGRRKKETYEEAWAELEALKAQVLVDTHQAVCP